MLNQKLTYKIKQKGEYYQKLNSMERFSIIIPCYNEEKTIEQTIEGLKKYLSINSLDAEIIVINDASVDKSFNILKEIEGIKTITHINNRGYGASLKDGARNATNDWIMFFDADGQHKPEYILDAINELKNKKCDMVIGKRVDHKNTIKRGLGKKILTTIAQYLVEQKIPDINSGFRIMRKNDLLRYENILPNSFSLSTTSTMAFLKDGLKIGYIPITINEREKASASTVKTKHGFQSVLLILRVIMIFNPLKIFFPISIFLLAAGTLFSLYGIFVYGRFPSAGVIIIVTGILTFFNGLLADQISNIKRG